MRSFRRLLPYVWVGFVVLAPLGSVLAGYLGPNRKHTEHVWRRRACSYHATYRRYGCHLTWYVSPSDDCPSPGSVADLFNATGLPMAGQLRGECRLSYLSGWRRPRVLFRGRDRLSDGRIKETYPEATTSGNLECPQWGEGGWCVGAADVQIHGVEPLEGYAITAIKGMRNGQGFACDGDSCAVALEEGENVLVHLGINNYAESALPW